MPYHVLHILGTAQPEGAAFARIVGPLASGLDPKRYSVHAWFIEEGGPLVRELKEAGAEVRVVKWRGGRGDPMGAWRFFRALRTGEFSIVHQHFGGRSLRWIARRTTRARIIAHVWGREQNESRSHFPVLRRVRGADVVIATSRAVAEVVLGSRPIVVYPGVRIADYVGTAAPRERMPGCCIVGTARRLAAIKGISYLLRAAALLRPRIPGLRVEIAGSGPERMCLEQQARSLGLEECVTFLGWQKDIASVLARWDVFVEPSLEEGFGIAALEAMAAGLPVVATAVGGIPELVEHGQTGWLVPPADSASLADRLGVLLLSPEQQHAMGAAGRARAREHFSAARMIGDISRIYDQVLGRG